MRRVDTVIILFRSGSYAFFQFADLVNVAIVGLEHVMLFPDEFQMGVDIR